MSKYIVLREIDESVVVEHVEETEVAQVTPPASASSCTISTDAKGMPKHEVKVYNSDASLAVRDAIDLYFSAREDIHKRLQRDLEEDSFLD
jgi:hypothetical protein